MAETLKMTTPLISAEAITKSYYKGQHKVPVLQGAADLLRGSAPNAAK